MSVEEIRDFAPGFVLIFIRIAAMMIYAPLFGSSRIPRRVKAMLALIIAMGLTGTVPGPAYLPTTTWELSMAIGGELAFGLAMGLILSFTFIAVQWAGEMIGQQMGLNLSEVFDPQFGAQGSLVGDLYFMLTLVVFLVIGGHHALLRGVKESFDALPVLTVGVNAQLVDLIVSMFQATTSLAIQVAAPTLVTMLVVDVALGFISKTVPQFNVMSAGLTIRSLVGMLLLIVGLSLSNEVISQSLRNHMNVVYAGWSGLVTN
jgi:flagellar biosynthetic protein FliR